MAENKETNEKTTKTNEKTTKIKMKNSYIGTKGSFYKKQDYELESTFAESLIKNGDAEKC